VSTRNREKRIRNQETRISAQEAAERRAKLRRWEIACGGIVLALLVAIVFIVSSDDDEKKKTTTTTTSTTAPGETTTTKVLNSAAGEPCVEFSDTLPKGAPAVPVKAGPPPKTLVKEDLEVGDGAVVKPGATVEADYIGVSCSTGKIFDTSYPSGVPVEFPLSNVIPGWQEGIPGMRVGGVRLLVIPPDQAYGSTANGDIRPDETLWFVVSLKSTK
jgi:peptidylprolyl isomerase